MKVAVFCSILFSVVMTTLSQPTYDLEQQQFCDGDCQQQIVKTVQDQFAPKFSAIKNEISQLLELKKQVDNFLQVFSGGGRSTVNGTMFPLPGVLPRSPSCPENFTYKESINGCYYVVNEKMNSHDANQRCISLHPNSHLVTINSDAEQTVVSDLLYEHLEIDQAWTAGLRVNLNITPSSFIWQVQTANRHLYKLPITVDHWGPNEPNDITCFCIIMYKHYRYMWIDGNCAWSGVNPLCEIEIA